MSTPQGNISTPAAAPPPSSAAPAAPAVAPPSGGTAPVAAPPSAAPEAVPQEIAEATAPVTPQGAQPSEPAKPRTIEEARAAYEKKAQAIQAGEGAQPKEAAPAEDHQPEVELETAPVEEPPALVETQVEAEPAAPVTDTDDLETVLTAEQIEAAYPRADKKLKAELVKREAHRGELVEKVHKIGGDPGLKLAEVFNPIIWNENPTTEDVDNFFDALVLPENAGAGKLFDLMGKHLVNTQLQDPDTGRDFGSNMIKEEFGKQPDNQTDYDLPFVENVIKLHKSWGVGADGKPIDLATVDLLVKALKADVITKEFLQNELAENAPAAPDPEKLAMQKELDDLKAGKTAEEKTLEEGKKAEAQRERERNKAIYKTQAKAWVSRQLLNEVMPLATTANWAASEGDTQAGPKTTLGKMVSAYVNSELMGSHDNPTAEYAEIMQMIEENTAFDPATGKPTPRFMVKMAPFATRARALFKGLQLDLNPILKFTAQSTRNAKLVKQNGGNKNGAAEEPPPIATSEPKKPAGEMSFEEKKAQLQEKYRKEEQRILAEANAGTL